MIKKTVIITGAGTGLGKKAAIAIAKRGHKVFATTQYENEATKLNELACSNNLPIEAFKLDICLETDRNIISNLDFDVLINNAAIGDSGSVSEIDINRLKNIFETNVFSNIALTQLALKKLISKRKGRIIFVSSLFGRINYPFLSPYCSSKFAIEALATSLRQELKSLDNTNIQVGIIEPGAYATSFNMKNINKKFEWMKEKSYFKYKLEDIKEKEEKFFNILESKNFSSIIDKYIHSVEDKKVKHRYTSPKFQSFFIQLGRMFGM